MAGDRLGGVDTSTGVYNVCEGGGLRDALSNDLCRFLANMDEWGLKRGGWFIEGWFGSSTEVLVFSGRLVEMGGGAILLAGPVVTWRD